MKNIWLTILIGAMCCFAMPASALVVAGSDWGLRPITLRAAKTKLSFRLILPQNEPQGKLLMYVQWVCSVIDEQPGPPYRKAVAIVPVTGSKFMIIEAAHVNNVCAERNLEFVVDSGYFTKSRMVGATQSFRTLHATDYCLICNSESLANCRRILETLR